MKNVEVHSLGISSTKISMKTFCTITAKLGKWYGCGTHIAYNKWQLKRVTEKGC